MAASTLTCRKRKLLKSGKLKLDVELETIKTLTKDILSSKKNCNKILNITQIAEDSREEVVCACIRAYHKIFCHYLEVNDLQTLKNEPDNSDNSLVKVRQWIKERYSDCVESLCEWLQHDISSIQATMNTRSAHFPETYFPEKGFSRITLSQDPNFKIIMSDKAAQVIT